MFILLLMDHSFEKDIKHLRICDYIQVTIDKEPTWLIVTSFVGRNEIIGIPLYEESAARIDLQPHVRVFKQSVIKCRKHRDWDELEIVPWLHSHKHI